MQGTHQYISLRGNPPNAEAQAALKPTPGELWMMRPSSVYFGNLFDGTRDLSGELMPGAVNQVAALDTGEALDPTPLWNRTNLLGVLNMVLGRECDATDCGYTDADGNSHLVILNNYTVVELTRPSTGEVKTVLAFQGDAASGRGQFDLVGTQTDPVHAFDRVARWAGGWTPGELPHRPLFVGMPAFDLFQGGPPNSPLEMPAKSIASTGTVPIDPAQYVAGATGTLGDPLVGLRGGQSLELVRTAASGEHCSGAKVSRGDGETGQCKLRSIYFDWNHLKVACREAGETLPLCRGTLVFDYRDRKWGWFCEYGGAPVYACTAVDAPVLDGAAFVPGRPWCASTDAQSFVGLCK